MLSFKPSNSSTTFKATVSGTSLTSLDGTITYTDNTTAAAPGTFTGCTSYGRTPGTDNMTWTAVDVKSIFGTSSINAIAYGGGKFVAVGGGGKMAYSSDGLTWTAIPAGTGAGTSTFGDLVGGSAVSNIIAVAYGNDRFVAVGDVGKTAYSKDGINRTAVDTGTIYEYTRDGSTYRTNIHSIAYGNGMFVIEGRLGKMAYSTRRSIMARPKKTQTSAKSGARKTTKATPKSG